jgi:hypothetical protein
MWFSSWLNKTQRSPAPHRRTTFRPTLEVLEGRCVPSILTVTSTKDHGPNSLRDDIAAAHNGDTIVFSPKLYGQKITLTTGELDITKSLTIQGPAPGQGHIEVSGDQYGDSRVFEVGANAVVTLSGLFISNGHAINNPLVDPSLDGQGGGIENAGTLTVSGCWLLNNVADLLGGGIYNTGTLTVINSTLESNGADSGNGGFGSGNSGGAIYNAGTLTVSGSTFSANRPDNIYGFYTDGGGNSFN